MWFEMLHRAQNTYIIESVDSISRDGPDTPIYVIQYKKLKNSAQVRFYVFKVTSSSSLSDFLSNKTKNIYENIV